MSRLIYFIALTWFSLQVCSCANTKQITYLQGSLDSSKLSEVKIPDLKIQKGDILEITVYSDNANKAIAPFNRTATAGAAEGASATGASGGAEYLVDNQGNIHFPVLGPLAVEGKTKPELIKMLSDSIERKYLTGTYYNIRFLNNRITLLGELNKPGPYSVPNERVNVLEAIGMAGDLTFFGRRDNVLVIREINGKREFGRIDLRDPNLFLSPYFQLQQNDVVYVDATKKKVSANDQSTIRTVSIASAIISTIAVVYSIFR
jgi:polysaccharide export outer membrane protein